MRRVHDHISNNNKVIIFIDVNLYSLYIHDIEFCLNYENLLPL